MVYTTIHILQKTSPILVVTHELDGDWTFMPGEPIEDFYKVGKLVALKDILQLDKTVLKVSDLPIGYWATRKSRKEKWEVYKIEYSDEELKQFGFYCSKCGLYHKDIPMSYGADAPYQYFLIPEAEREKRGELTADQCIIDEQTYFVRGQIELPVEDNPDKFSWNVWVEVSKTDFERMGDVWEEENRILEPPYPGKIATTLDPYPDTLNLPASVITRNVGIVPKIEISECNHALFLEQENGINMKRVTDFARQLLYNH